MTLKPSGYFEKNKNSNKQLKQIKMARYGKIMKNTSREREKTTEQFSSSESVTDGRCL